MKKLLFLICLVIANTGLFAQFSGSGSGTSTDPYLISNGDELNQIRSFLNNTNVYFKLINDIDLKTWIDDNNPSQGWTPIGNSGSSRFMGTLDGDDFAIKSFLINRATTDYIGFFGYTEGAKIKNIKFINASVKGKDYVGTLIGYNVNSTITNISAITSINGANYVGGLIGYYIISGNGLGNSISYNSINGDINGITNIGGLVGYSYVSSYANFYEYTTNMNIINNITNCVVIGKNDVGGLLGFAKVNTDMGCSSYPCSTSASLIIGNNYSFSKIEGANNVGGLIGESNSDVSGIRSSVTLNVTKNYSSGFIKGNDNVGGVIGYHSTGVPSVLTSSNIINDNYSTGEITGINNVGGIIGYLTKVNNSSGEQRLSNNYSANNIYCKNNGSGGIIGKSNRTTINNNVAINNILSGLSRTNRICGENESGSTFSNNYALVKTVILENGEVKQVVDDDLNGIGSGLSSLKLKATYQGLGFDFTNTWNISNTESFPYFIWQTAPAEFSNKPYKPDFITVSGKCTADVSIILNVNDISYNTIATGNTWSILVPILKAGDELSVTAQTTGLWPSYPVWETVQLNGDGTSL